MSMIWVIGREDLEWTLCLLLCNCRQSNAGATDWQTATLKMCLKMTINHKTNRDGRGEGRQKRMATCHSTAWSRAAWLQHVGVSAGLCTTDKCQWSQLHHFWTRWWYILLSCCLLRLFGWQCCYQPGRRDENINMFILFLSLFSQKGSIEIQYISLLQGTSGQFWISGHLWQQKINMFHICVLPVSVFFQMTKHFHVTLQCYNSGLSYGLASCSVHEQILPQQD